jgi:hypothetical protein
MFEGRLSYSRKKEGINPFEMFQEKKKEGINPFETFETHLKRLKECSSRFKRPH